MVRTGPDALPVNTRATSRSRVARRSRPAEAGPARNPAATKNKINRCNTPAPFARETAPRRRELLTMQNDLKAKDEKLQKEGAVMAEADRAKAEKTHWQATGHDALALPASERGCCLYQAAGHKR